jgi:transposase
LTRLYKDLRKTLCRKLLDLDLSDVIFLDAAAIRLHDEGIDRCWQKEGEELYKDVRTETVKTFADGQFFGAICYGKRQGPWHIFPPETPEEVIAADQDLQFRNEPLDRLNTLTFEAARLQEERELEKAGKKRRGPAPQLGVFLKKRRLTRGDREKGNGVDWYRLNEFFLEPKVFPWYKELKKEGRSPLLAMDNAGPHKSYYTKIILDLYGIIQLLWPPQSPDLNPIEQIWKYIRQQIRQREHYPENKEQMFKAWEEEWMKVPQHIINHRISKILKRAQQVLDNDGDNNFHG